LNILKFDIKFLFLNVDVSGLMRGRAMKGLFEFCIHQKNKQQKIHFQKNINIQKILKMNMKES
jgi:hypothetical protein